MALELTDFDVADYIATPEDAFYHLKGEIEENEPPFLAKMLDAVLRARGGAENLAVETGIPALEFEGLAKMDDAAIRKLATRVMEAYRRQLGSPSQVA